MPWLAPQVDGNSAKLIKVPTCCQVPPVLAPGFTLIHPLLLDPAVGRFFFECHAKNWSRPMAWIAPAGGHGVPVFSALVLRFALLMANIWGREHAWALGSLIASAALSLATGTQSQVCFVWAPPSTPKSGRIASNLTRSLPTQYGTLHYIRTQKTVGAALACLPACMLACFACLPAGDFSGAVM